MRARFKILFGIIATAVVLIAVVSALRLLPAHLQVRRIEPSLPTATQLRALLKQESKPVGIRYVNTSDQQLPTGALTHSVFVVAWESGDLFMVDSGMSASAAKDFGDRLNSLLGGSPPVIHGTIAQLLGDDVKRVRGVGYTHLHSDHAEGTHGFCAARGADIQLVQTEFQATEHNFNTSAGAQWVKESCAKGEPLRGDGILQIAEFPGIGVIPLGGHTPDSTLFAIPVGNTLYLLSGDIVNRKQEMIDDLGKGWIYSYLLVPEHVERSAMLRRWLKELDAEPDMRVVVSHDLLDIQSSGIPQFGAVQ